MSRFEHLRHPVDTFRTAPAGFLLTAAGIVLGGESLAEISNNPNAFVKAASVIQFGVESLGAAVGITMVAHQFKLRRRLERSIDRSGYDSRLMARTTGTWCDQQTGRVVSKMPGMQLTIGTSLKLPKLPSHHAVTPS